MKTLYLEKRGCDFWKDEPARRVSDVGNYRVCTTSECIPGKDGNTYFLSFGMCNPIRYRKTNKRTGAPLKTPVKEEIMKHMIYMNTQYTDAQGLSWRNSDIERAAWDEAISSKRLYTLGNILHLVNSISSEHYDNIEFV